MKKVIFFYSGEILGRDGGSVGAKKYFNILNDLAGKKAIEKPLVVSLDNFPNFLGITIKKNRFLDILSRMFFKSSYLFFYLLKYRGKFLYYKPDAVYFSSRMGFLAKFFRKRCPGCRVFLYFDNIEFDYCKNVTRAPAKFLEEAIVYQNEKTAINYSTFLFFLTKRDEERCHSLYQKSLLIPSCLFPVTLEGTRELEKISTKPTVVLLGNLAYKPNIASFYWFLNQVFPLLDQSFSFIVAGSHPGKDIELSCQENHITLVSNFEKIEDFAPKKSCLLAPLFIGSGMKTKIAEGLSCGMFVIGTHEAFVGYEALFSEDHRFVFEANNASEMVECLLKYRESFYSKNSFEQNVTYFRKYYMTSSYSNELLNLLNQNFF